MGLLDKFKKVVGDAIESGAGGSSSSSSSSFGSRMRDEYERSDSEFDDAVEFDPDEEEDVDDDYENPRYKKIEDWDEDKILKVHEGLLHEVEELLKQAYGDKFENARIKHKPDDWDKLELQFRIDGRPVKVFWDSATDYSPGCPEIYAKCNNKFGREWSEGHMHLNRDYDEIPKTVDSEDDWEDEADQEVRVFMEKGIYFEGTGEEVNTMVSVFNAFPAEMREKVLKGMESFDITYFRLYDEQVEVTFNPDLSEMRNDAKSLAGMTQLTVEVAELADGAEKVEVNDDARGALQAERVTCKYCGTKFIFGMRDNCPNCGAAHSA